MRVALLSDSIYPYNKGGKETRSFQLVNELSKRGHDVHFYTMKFWKGSSVMVKNGVTYHGICKEYPMYNGDKRSIKQGIMFGLASFKLLFEKFDILDADHMVYFHIFPARLACWLRGKKLVVTWHEVWGKNYWREYMGWKGVFGYFMEKLSSILADRIIAVSKDTSSDLVKVLGVKKSKVKVIENGLHLSEIEKVDKSKETSDIIYVGRLLSHKNVDVLIEAVKGFKGKVLIVGGGVELNRLKKLANDNIEFKGFVESHDEVIALMKSSKAFVLPSTREGFGITIIEANACSLPVVTIDVPTNAGRSLIKDGENGYLCSLDSKSLRSAIDKALSKRDWSTKSYVYKYDWNHLIMKFEEVYS